MGNTVGKFAEIKMTYILEQLQKGNREKMNEIYQTIEMIGEPMIKEQFEHLYQEKFGDNEVGLLKKRIEELEEKLNQKEK